MGAPNYTIQLVSSPVGAPLGFSPGDVMLFDGTNYVLATAAARAGGARASGVALGSAPLNGAVLMQACGDIPATITGLGAGAQSWVRVSTTGRLERCTPSGSDDIVGRCEADGTMHAGFGFLTAAMVTGGGGGTPGGSDQQFQYNNAGAFAGAPGANWDAATGQFKLAAGKGILFPNVANTFNGRLYWDVSAVRTAVLPDATGTIDLTDNTATLTNKTISGANNTLTVRLNADVTSVLPLANGGTNASSGLTTPNGVVTSSGTALQQASNVLAGSNFLSVGVPPAASGALRFPSAAELNFRNNANSGDLCAITSNSGDNLIIGVANDFSSRACGIVYINPATSVNIGSAGGTSTQINITGLRCDALSVGSTNPTAGVAKFSLPIFGDFLASPFSVHGRMPIRSLAGLATYTALAAEYAYQVLQFSGDPTGTNCTVTIPSPATEDLSYFQDVDVNQVVSTDTVTFKCGSGTRTAAITGGGFGVTAAPKRLFVSPNCVDLAPG